MEARHRRKLVGDPGLLGSRTELISSRDDGRQSDPNQGPEPVTPAQKVSLAVAEAARTANHAGRAAARGTGDRAPNGAARPTVEAAATRWAAVFAEATATAHACHGCIALRQRCDRHRLGCVANEESHGGRDDHGGHLHAKLLPDDPAYFRVNPNKLLLESVPARLTGETAR